MLGCVTFFPRLAHIVNQGVRRGAEPHFHCADSIARGVTGGLRGVGNPTLWVWGSALKNFGFGPYVRLGGPTYGFVHDFRTCFLDAMVFRSMVLDAMVFSPWYWMLRHV